MAYYPTFIFFKERPDLIRLARILVEELADDLPEISFKVGDNVDSDAVVFENKEMATKFLSQEGIDISRFWLASDLHSLEFESIAQGYLEVDFWDFAPEIYDLGEPTNEMKLAKKKLAIALHATLLEINGALFSYTSSADDKYQGSKSHYQIADEIFSAIKNHELQTLEHILIEPLYFWLIGLNKTADNAQVIEGIIKQELMKISDSEGSVIFEHIQNNPYPID